MGSLAIFSKFNRYIIYTTLSALFNKCINGMNFFGAFELVRISGENFSKNIIIHKLFFYIGTIILAVICSKIEIISSRKESLKKPIQKDKEKEKKAKMEIELIYIDSEEELNNFKTFKFNCLYSLIIIIWVIEEQLIESFDSLFPNLDFWMIELFIICYLNSLVFKIQIFNHQKVAILFSLFSILLKICTIISLFYDESLKTEYSPIYYINNPTLKIIFGIILYIILVLLRSIVNLSLKWYMDIKYISHNHILMTYGIIGTILYLIFVVIITQFNCELNDSKVYNYICPVNYNNKYYIDSFYNYFNNYKNGFNEIIREIIVIIFGILAFFFNKIFSILVIKYLSPVHVIFSFPILFTLEKIVMLSNTIILRNISEKNDEDKSFVFFTTDNKFLIAKFFLDISGDIFSLIGFLIYLEIIRLKCGQFHYNTKDNIIQRGTIELMVIGDNSRNSSFNSENDKLEDRNDSFKD